MSAAQYPRLFVPRISSIPENAIIQISSPVSILVAVPYFQFKTPVMPQWQFHWAFYLATTPRSGRILHFVNNIDPGHVWKYVSRLMTGVLKSSMLLVALKIAVMDPVFYFRTYTT
ncbi:hypothetical protein BDW62DRAFT_203682 [Aspergillus aurantiobrunneus]